MTPQSSPLRLVANNPEFRTAANTASITSSTTAARTDADLANWLSGLDEFRVNLKDATSSDLSDMLQALDQARPRLPLDLLETDGDEMAGPTREEIEAKLETVAAQTDTKFARLDGKMDLVLSKLDDAREGNRHTQNIIVSVGIGLALLIIGVVAAAPIIFDLGSKFRETISKEIQEQTK